MKGFHGNFDKIKGTLLWKLPADWINSTWHAEVSQLSNIHFDKVFALSSSLLSMGRTEQRVEQAQ